MSATRTQVYLTDEQRQRVDAIAEAEGVTMAAVIRRAPMPTLPTRAPIHSSHSRPPSAQLQTPRSPAETNGTVADILVDTSVFIDHLRGVRQLAAGGHRFHHSVVTRVELFAGTTPSNLVSTLLEPFREIPVDRVVAETGWAYPTRNRCPPSRCLDRGNGHRARAWVGHAQSNRLRAGARTPASEPLQAALVGAVVAHLYMAPVLAPD